MKNQNIALLLLTATLSSNAFAASDRLIYVDQESPTVNDKTFSENSGNNNGGAIFTSNSDLKISNTTFTENAAIWDGGAIYVYTGSLNADNTTFTRNTSDMAGAIYSNDATINLKNSAFSANTANTAGGAIYLFRTNSTLENLNFNNNRATTAGGAIGSYLSETNLKNSTFTDNNAKNGGAIYGRDDSVNVSDTTFTENTATENGGAIYAYNSEINISADTKDVAFTGNRAQHGAAIYGISADVTINAAGGNILFDNNGETGIELTSTSSLSLLANAGKTITINDNVSALNGTVNVNSSNHQGNVILTNGLTASILNLNGGILNYKGNSLTIDETVFNGGALDLRNGTVNTFNIPALTVDKTSNLYLDVNLADAEMDALTYSSLSVTDGTLNIAGLNLLNDTEDMTTSINFNQNDLKDYIAYTGEKTITSDFLLYRYDVDYSATDGNFEFARHMGSNPYYTYNPNVFGSAIAMQGAYLTQLANYDTVFGNVDQKILMRHMQKNCTKHNTTDQKTCHARFVDAGTAGVRFTPYASFGKVKLDNGPKADNDMYGGLIETDSKTTSFDSGWDMQFTGYVGYNGSHQKYDGVSIYQNGAVVGAGTALYKDNFFTAATANIGIHSANITPPSIGDNHLTMLATGIASKTGYNFEFFNGKFIVQPNLTMSYTFINPRNDYTLGNGIRIKNDNLNAAQIAPALKLIGTSDNGWQPYASVKVLRNFVDNSKVKAAYISLPETTVKSYREYELGMQKDWDKKWSGYGQTVFRDGGRTGCAFMLGIRYTFGD